MKIYLKSSWLINLTKKIQMPNYTYQCSDCLYEFEEFKTIAKSKGFLLASSSPLTRSSYHADKDFAILQKNRTNQTNA